MKNLRLLWLLMVFGLISLGGYAQENDCDCEFDFIPVCVEDAEGNIFEFPDACLAECSGLTVLDTDECDAWDGEEEGEGDENDPWETDCDCDDEYDPVCVEDEEGNVFSFPSACLAECLGLPVVDGDCDDIDWDEEGEDPWGNDCECDDEYDPVCVEDEEGNIFSFPNACFAECIGLTVVDGDCEEFEWDEEGDEDYDCPWGEELDCDCDEEEFNPVCVEDEEGNIFSFPSACLAECIGLTVVEGDCDDFDWDEEGEDPWENDCECDEEEWDPVCVVDEEGFIFQFPSACFAECIGLEVVEADCDEFDWEDEEGEDDPWETDCDCDENELDPVCVEDEFGNVFSFPSACIAECLGLTVVDGDCDEFDWEDEEGEDDPWETDCDCDENELDPVCVEDGEGNIFAFPSACIAECLGFTVVDGDCDEFDWDWEDEEGDEEEDEGGDTWEWDGNDFGWEGVFGLSEADEQDLYYWFITLVPTNSVDKSQVIIDATSDAITQIEIYNVTGQIVYNATEIISAGSNQIEIDMSGLQRGMYILKVSDNLQHSETTKFMKQ